jgi:hypothetical protein
VGEEARLENGTWKSGDRPEGSSRLPGIGSILKSVTKSLFHRDSDMEISLVVHVMIWNPKVDRKGREFDSRSSEIQP